MARLFLCILIIFTTLTSLAQNRKFLLIGIDGCRADALQAALTPNVDALIANSLYSYEAQTRFPTYSGPGWSSMLTGVWYEKHGVLDNTFSGSNYDDYPHFFTLLKEADPDLKLASVVQWSPINQYILSSADVAENNDLANMVESISLDQISDEDLDGLMIHFDDVDIAGHDFGYGPENPQYLEAIQSVDTRIGNILTALQARPDYAEEEWLVVVSTDHGATESGHGGASPEERNIFVVFSGDNFPNEEITADWTTVDSDPSNALNLNQNNVYGVLDHEVYEFEENEDFTIEFRIKTNGWEGDPAIVSDKNWLSGYNPGFVLACQTDEETWKFNLGDGDDRIDLDGGAINDGEWHHCAVSCDRDGVTFLWQDGQMLSATTATLTGSIVSGYPVGVGQDGTLNYDFDFDGWIDELHIWNVALDEETIATWSCENVPATHPNFNDLIGFWKMEELTDLGVDGTDPNNQVDMMLFNGPYVSLEEAMSCPTPENETPRIVDIVPTILTHMCVEIDNEWDLDGLARGIDLSSCGVIVQENTLDQLILSPNPAIDHFRVSSPVFPLDMQIIDASGKVVADKRVESNATLDISHLEPGMYVVSFYSRVGKSQRKLIVSQN